MLREGGLQAFITSQGILNSPNNEPIRRALMENNNLVSVVRLPNNLFTDYAGTEVGSDLIILQKNTAKQNLTEREDLFCQSNKRNTIHPAMRYSGRYKNYPYRLEIRYRPIRATCINLYP
jgi:type I restriction-modification system DNA methylase subunit